MSVPNQLIPRQEQLEVFLVLGQTIPYHAETLLLILAQVATNATSVMLAAPDVALAVLVLCTGFAAIASGLAVNKQVQFVVGPVVPEMVLVVLGLFMWVL